MVYEMQVILNNDMRNLFHSYGNYNPLSEANYEQMIEKNDSYEKAREFLEALGKLLIDAIAQQIAKDANAKLIINFN